MHGLIFETSICYWQDQPVSYPSHRGLAHASRATRTYVRTQARRAPPLDCSWTLFSTFSYLFATSLKNVATPMTTHALGARVDDGTRQLERNIAPTIYNEHMCSAAGIRVQHTHCSVHLTGSTAFARSENAATSHLCSRRRSTIANSPSSSLQPPSTYLPSDGASMPKAYRASYEKKMRTEKRQTKRSKRLSMHDASHLSRGMLWEGQKKI